MAVNDRTFLMPDNSILHDLARSYRLFGDDDSRTLAHDPSNEQVAIASFCSLVWGVEKWLHFLDDVREMDVPLYSDEDVAVAAKEGYYGRGQMYGRLAKRMFNDVVSRINEIDVELAEILDWNHAHALGGWAATAP